MDIQSQVTPAALVRLWHALGSPEYSRLCSGQSIDDALIYLAISRINPASPEAAEIEYHSWYDVMMYEREDRCPDGQHHDEDPSAAEGPGYYAKCLRCGHNTRLPF